MTIAKSALRQLSKQNVRHSHGLGSLDRVVRAILRLLENASRELGVGRLTPRGQRSIHES